MAIGTHVLKKGTFRGWRLMFVKSLPATRCFTSFKPLYLTISQFLEVGTLIISFFQMEKWRFRAFHMTGEKQM